MELGMLIWPLIGSQVLHGGTHQVKMLNSISKSYITNDKIVPVQTEVNLVKTSSVAEHDHYDAINRIHHLLDINSRNLTICFTSLLISIFKFFIFNVWILISWSTNLYIFFPNVFIAAMGETLSLHKRCFLLLVALNFKSSLPLKQYGQHPLFIS